MEKLLSTADIALLLDKSKESVSAANWKYLHMNPVKVEHQNYMWNSEQVDAFKRYFAAVHIGRRVSEEELAEIKKELPPEIDELEHPLVTDKRFFKTSFFPSLEEITPLCFLQQEKI